MKSLTFLARFTMGLSMAVLFGWVSLAVWAGPAGAASIEAPAGPAANDSAMYSTDNLYNRLNSGATPGKRTNGFNEPAAGPGSSRKSLNEVMAVMPVPDNANGVAPANVASGKTFWGLRTDGSWGPQTGTSSTAYPALVPKTGQTTCYNDSGTVIPCAGTGQDGDKLKGVALPNPRFTNNNNGTVTDNLTGLLWLTNANCATVSPKAWTAALTAVASLKSGDCGLSDGSVAGDWRVPNEKELSSLVNRQYSYPALSNTAGTAKWTEGNPFSGVQANNWYWSATTYAGNTNYAWVVYLNNGYVSWYSKTNSYYVWPVRGGQ